MSDLAVWPTPDAERPLDQRPLSGLPTLVGAVATAAMLIVGAVLAVIFAATLAVVMALATALLGLFALGWRLRRRPRAQGVLLEARRVGHSWVAYGWDRADPRGAEIAPPHAG